MSRQRALRAIRRQTSGDFASHELIEDPRFVHEVTGIDPRDNTLEAFATAYRRLEVDLIWPHTLPETLPRATESWGIASLRPYHNIAFHCSEDVVKYDPREWVRTGRISGGVPLDPSSPHLIDDLAAIYERSWRRKQEAMGDAAVVAGAWGYTLFHFLVNTFGFEAACTAAMDLPAEFSGLLERFAAVSAAAVEAWSRLPLELFISHDDLAMQTGTIFPPDWYREHILPWYSRLWEGVRGRGIPILFWSDGDYSAILDDIVACGADGFMIEPMIDLAAMARRHGRTKFIVGNVDSRVLSFKGEAEVRTEVARCLDEGRPCAGHFLCATGSITNTMPLHNIRAYFAAVAERRREARLPSPTPRGSAPLKP